MNRRVAVRGIFIKNDKLLCVWLKDYANIGPIDYWCLVGGGVDPGESLIEALKREIIEETNIKPVIGRLLVVQQFIRHNTEQLEFFFNIENVDDYLDVDLSKASHGAIEIEKIDYINPRKHKVLPDFLSSDEFKEFDVNGDVKILDYID